MNPDTKGKDYTHILKEYTQLGVNDILSRSYEQAKNNGIHNAAALIIDHQNNKVIAYAGNILNIDSNIVRRSI